jgi:hypothetical protein
MTAWELQQTWHKGQTGSQITPLRGISGMPRFLNTLTGNLEVAKPWTKKEPPEGGSLNKFRFTSF